jgi:ribonuclease R
LKNNNTYDNIGTMIKTLLKNQTQISFKELAKLTNLPFAELAKEIAKEKDYLLFNNIVYDKSSLEKAEGFIYSLPNGNTLFSEKELNTNDYGIYFSPLEIVSEKEQNLEQGNKEEAEIKVSSTQIIPKQKYNGYKISIILAEQFLDENQIVQTKEVEKINFIPESIIESQEVKVIAKVVNKSLFSVMRNVSLETQLSEDKNKNIIDSLENNFVELLLDKENNLKVIHNFGNANDSFVESNIAKHMLHLKTDNSQDTENTNFNNLEKLQQLENLESLNFVTIDGANTKDIDDAVCAKKTDSGYEIYIAIADVSTYVKKNTQLDLNAKEQTTTFYLDNVKVVMLPKMLSENLCSLNPGEKRNSLVCKVSLDKEFTVLNSQFIHAKILSHAKLTYDDVDNYLANQDKETNEEIFKESFIYNQDKQSLEKISPSLFKSYQLDESLSILNNYAKHYQSTKTREELYWPSRVDYTLNEAGKIQTMFEENEQSPAQQLVEASMLLANRESAKYLSKDYPYLGLFRNQYEPINGLAQPAFYDFSNVGHWGLETEHYTHFTSPIRRYTDLIVHRLIKNKLEIEKCDYTNDELKEIVKQNNLMSQLSKFSENKSHQLLIDAYTKEQANKQENTKVVNIFPNGILIRGRTTFIDNFIPLFKLEKDMPEIKTFAQDLNLAKEKEKFLRVINKTYKIKMYYENYSEKDKKLNFRFKCFLRAEPSQNRNAEREEKLRQENLNQEQNISNPEEVKNKTGYKL